MAGSPLRQTKQNRKLQFTSRQGLRCCASIKETQVPRSTIWPSSSLWNTCSMRSFQLIRCLAPTGGKLSLLSGYWHCRSSLLNVPYGDGTHASGTDSVTARHSAALCSSTCSLCRVSLRSILCSDGTSIVFSSSISCHRGIHVIYNTCLYLVYSTLQMTLPLSYFLKTKHSPTVFEWFLYHYLNLSSLYVNILFLQCARFESITFT
jgi:hypothetical protein